MEWGQVGFFSAPSLARNSGFALASLKPLLARNTQKITPVRQANDAQEKRSSISYSSAHGCSAKRGLNFTLIFILYRLVSLRKWKPYLVSSGNMLEQCTNFRGMKWGNYFELRSEIQKLLKAIMLDISESS